ncbi:armadillo-type protein [Polychytrium aggregatum]|uniref:armadillo-type protein n=1 Tax=Polychytrium aggregatum TaxID=110093 RepID=UPI0022FE2FBC|nr:armadillo-type protein [Polychytrium aggregatum]KAI9202178.1 armadillo-type protein [Polychytrium aggregatum]
MEDLERAILVALDPFADPNVKLQANQYYAQVKASPDACNLALGLFMKSPASAPEIRFMALQMLEEVLQASYEALEPNFRVLVRQRLWKYLSEEMPETEVIYIKTKLVVVLVILFKNQYLQEWPTFFDELLSLLETTKGTPKFPTMVDLFLRFSVTIDTEVVSLLIVRSSKETALNTLIKDKMRERDVARLAAVWFDILASHHQSNPEIACEALHVIGLYVSWIDVTIFVHPTFMNMLYQLLSVNSVRSAACQCLVEIVAKGMKPADKLRMIHELQLVSILDRLQLDDEDFTDHVAKLVNMIGLELCKCWEEFDNFSDAQTVTFTLIQQLFPHLTLLLSNEYDDTTLIVFDFLEHYLAVLKRQKKLAGGQISEQLRDNLVALLRVLVMKMNCDEDSFQFGEDAGESEALFLDMRKSLKQYVDAIAVIDYNLYLNFHATEICQRLDVIAASPTAHSWSYPELTLHLLYLIGEPIKGPLQFVTVAENGTSTMTLFGTMLEKMITSNISSYPHESVAPIFFENVARYAGFFESCPQYIPNVLQAFVDVRGLHHSSTSVRCRVNYLFLRFVKTMRLRLLPYVEHVITNVQDLLLVARPPPPPNDANSDVSSIASEFDSQLYLFEAIGMLISLEGIVPVKQEAMLQAILAPLLVNIQDIMEKESEKLGEEAVIYHLNHLITAIGSVGKGFPDHEQAAKNAPVALWPHVFQQAMNAILVVLTQLNASTVIREAARFTFQRMVGCMGTLSLPYTHHLLKAGLLAGGVAREVIDFLPVISLIMHKFQPHEILQDILGPLMERIFFFLNQPANGTDDLVILNDMRKAYLTFIGNIFNEDLEAVLVSSPQMQPMLQSVLAYASNLSDPISAKIALSVLSKTVAPIPGYSQFIYASIVPILFQLPVSPEFNMQNGDFILIFTEIATLHKVILATLGLEYVDYLLKVYFVGIQCPDELAREFTMALQKLDIKQFKKYLQVGHALLHLLHLST